MSSEELEEIGKTLIEIGLKLQKEEN